MFLRFILLSLIDMCCFSVLDVFLFLVNYFFIIHYPFELKKIFSKINNFFTISQHIERYRTGISKKNFLSGIVNFYGGFNLMTSKFPNSSKTLSFVLPYLLINFCMVRLSSLKCYNWLLVIPKPPRNLGHGRYWPISFEQTA